MKFNKIFLLAGIVAVGMFTSCSDDDDDYKKGPQVTGQGVNFGEISQSESLVTKEKSLSFDVFREDATNAVDIPLTVVRNDTVEGAGAAFQIPANVHFDAGQDKASFTVKFPSIPVGVDYCFVVKIPEEYAHYYKVNTFSRTVQLDYTWIQVPGYLVDDFAETSGEVTLEHALTSNKWRILKPMSITWVDEDGNPDYNPSYVAEVIEVEIQEDGSVKWGSFRYGTYDTVSHAIAGDVYEDGDWYQINAYVPSQLSSSVAAYDEYSGVDPEDATCLELVPYFYIPGLGGFGLYAMDFYIDEDGMDWFTK